MKNQCLLETLLIAWRTSWEVWTKLGPLNVSCWLSVPPPHIYLSDMWRELYIRVYTEPWGTIPQHKISLSLGLVTHWFPPHHHHCHQQHHLPLLRVWCPHWSELNFGHLWTHLMRLTSCLTVPRTSWSEWTWFWQPPLGLMQCSPLESFLW
jgi:hypothetical protein